MSDQCLPGLQGWPVNIGSYVESAFTRQPIDIRLQFGSTQIPWTYYSNGFFSIQGSHNFLMNGTQYEVKAVRICRPRQTGLSVASPFAEYQIWGLPSDRRSNPNTIAVLVIPIYSTSSSDIFGDTLYTLLTGQATTFGNTIPRGDAVRIVRYSTCIETTGPATYNIQTAYWSTGLKMTSEQTLRIQRNLQPQIRLTENGIPKLLFEGGPIAISAYTNSGGTKTNRQSQVIENDSVVVPYQNSPAMPISDPLFQTTFRLIEGFQGTVTQLDTKSYKCVAVNRATDIKNGKLLIDPTTGERLDQELEARNAEETYTVEDQTIYPGDIAKWIGIAIGTLIGIALIYTGYYWFKKGMARPKDVVDVAEAIVAPGVAPGVAPVSAK